MIRLKVTPVVGLPQFTGWSQVAESTSSASTRLISVFAISGKHAGNVGRDVSDKIADFYYYDVEQLHEFIQELVGYADENECELFISCALINGNKSVFVTRGGSVFLKRKEKIGKILYSEDQIKIVSGNYIENDVFVLTTLQASQFLNEIEQKFSKGFDVDIIITSVVPGLHAQADSSLSAIVFINQFSSEEDFFSSKRETLREPSLEASIELDDFSSEEDINSHLEVDMEAEMEDGMKAGMEVDGEDQLIDQKSGDLIISSDLPNKLFEKLKHIGSFFKKIEIKNELNKLKTLKLNRIVHFLARTIGSMNKKTVAAMVAILFIFVVILSVVINIRNESLRISGLLEPMQVKLVEASEQLALDPISSRNMASEVVSSLEKLIDENQESRSLKLIEDQLTEAKSFYDEISGKKELSELEVFYDLRLIKSDYIANDADVNDTNLVLLDSEKKQVINLDILSKKVEVKDFSEFGNASDLALNDNIVFVLSDGIKSFELVNKSEISTVKELGDSNKNASFVNSYDRFIYVLNPDKRNIFRYSKDGEEYSDPIGWIKSATSLKYDEITSFSIDGDIWLTNNTGEIRKLTSGREENFLIRGLSDNFSSNIKIFTNINQKNIYVLEADKNRIVVLSKEGEFIKEIKSVSLSTVGSIAVSEKLNKIFAVSGSIVFEIPLNNEL